MNRLMGAFAVALTAACAHAQPAAVLPQDFVEVAFNMGKNFGMAEALVQSCQLAVVDPKIRQSVMSTFPGFEQGWHQALHVADSLKIAATVKQKRCLLGLEMYGPKGTAMENLIIMLGKDGQR